MSLFPKGCVEDFEKDNFDPEVIEDFFIGFTFVVHSFGDMDDDMGALGLLKIGFLNEWMPFYFGNENFASMPKCTLWTKMQKSPTFNPWWAFEFLFQHLEHDALEAYKSWSEWVTVQIIL
jgi:hypothetical protein